MKADIFVESTANQWESLNKDALSEGLVVIRSTTELPISYC